MKIFDFSNGVIESSTGRVFYTHNGKDSSATAFEIDEKAQIRILLPRILGVVSVNLEIYNESTSCLLLSKEAVWSDLYEAKDIYEVDLRLKDIGVGLYYFRIIIESAFGRLYAYKEKDLLRFSRSWEEYNFFQLTVSSFIHNPPKKKYGGIIYHIFVDRFNRGGNVKQKKNTILVDDWRNGIPEYPAYPGAPLKNNMFYGGTLWGIIDKLDYIASLGVDTLYLSPIFDATSNHKYDTADYMTIDSMFGGKAAFKALIMEAKKYGIGIILDGVFNHTGSDSIYFNREGNYKSVGAYQSKSSEYYSWYDFQSFPDKYTCWWGIDILPRINTLNPKCRDYFVGKDGVIETYAKMGIDGFRLDVADELSDDFISEIKMRLSESNPESVLYGEVWEDASNKIAYDTRKKYYLGRELDGVMNYPIRTGIIDFLIKGSTDSLFYALTDVLNNAPNRIRNMQMNLLGTHDTERILTLLGGESSAGRSNSYLAKKRMNDIERGIAKRKLRMAYTILATIPGIPTIFYGDEAGLEGYHDPFNRMPYPWGREDANLIAFYRKIGILRRSNDVYKDGDFRLHLLESKLLVFSRWMDNKAYITFVNNSKFHRTVTFNRTANALIVEKRGREFTVPAYTAEIYVVDKNTTISISD